MEHISGTDQFIYQCGCDGSGCCDCTDGSYVDFCSLCGLRSLPFFFSDLDEPSTRDPIYINLTNPTRGTDSLSATTDTFIGISDDTDPDSNLIKLLSSNSSNYFLENAFNNMITTGSLQSAVKILHVNIRSYSKNYSSLWNYLLNIKHKFHIIALTETWTSPDDEYLLAYPGYNTFTKSRHPAMGGGGVALLVDDTFQTEVIEIEANANSPIESLFITTTPPMGKPLIIGSIYRPPKSNMLTTNNDFEKILATLSNQNKSCYLCGDFNMNLLNINTHQYTSDFLNLMSTFLFRPLIHVPTRITNSSSTLIDNIFTNSLSFRECPGVFITDISDHLPIFAILDHQLTPSNKPKFISYRCKSPTAYNSFESDLKNISWKNTLSLTNPDSILESLDTILYGIYNCNFPVITRKARIYKTKLKPWMSSALLKSCKTKNKLYRKYLKSKSTIAYSKYKTYKNKLTTILRNCEKNYYANLLELHKSNLKETWKIIREVLNQPNSKPTNIPLTVNGALVADPITIANEFNNYFASIGPTMAATIPRANLHPSSYLKNPNPNSMFINPVTTNEVIDITLNLKNTKPYNCFELPNHIIKKIAPITAEPVAHLLNQSFQTGIVPSAMKVAIISPIFKSGDQSDLVNYRPISKLTCLSKVMERAMHNRLTDFLDSNNILYNKQFGFRKNHSTTHAIIEVVDKLTETMDQGKATIGVFLDLSKAFDTIKHDILLDKLAHYGVRGTPLDWFKSYLTGRLQQVYYHNTLSNLASILCGVPQGSILGPLLFLIYINDITNCSDKLLMFLFADDTTVFITGSSNANLFTTMNMELNNLGNWFQANLMSLNAKKTNYIIFSSRRRKIPEDNNLNISINSTPIKRVPQIKFLGIIIDEHLTWQPHINIVKNKIAKTIGIIKRLRSTLPKTTLRTLYNSLILPHLNYGNVIWAGGYETSLLPIFLLQKKVVRLISGTGYLAPSSHLFYSLNLLTIFDLYKLQLATLMYHHQNKTLPTIFFSYFTTNATVHDHETRFRHNLRSILCKTNIRYFSVRLAGPRIWNTIDSHTRNLGTSYSFKLTYRKTLLHCHL